MLEKQLRSLRLGWQRSEVAALVGPVILLVLLAATLILGWLLRDLAQEMIVEQVAFSLWRAGLFLRGLPQTNVWELMALIALVHLVWAFLTWVSLPAVDRVSYKQGGPVRGWLETLGLNTDSSELGRIPLSRLQHVVLLVLSQEGSRSLGEMRSRLRSGRLDIDPALLSFLQTGRSAKAANKPVTQAPEIEALLNFMEESVGGKR
jgi:hypothetical protein